MNKREIGLFIAISCLAILKPIGTIIEYAESHIPGAANYWPRVIGVALAELSIPLCVILIAGGIFVAIKNKRDNDDTQLKQIEELRKRIVDDSSPKNGRKDILELMLNNMSEIQEYYSISKRHAWLSFALAVVFCILGAAIFAQAFAADIESQQPLIISVIGGTISEIFAGTALLVYKSSLKQLNRYYLALHENERFLSTVNLVDRLSDGKREEAIMKIIDKSLSNITGLAKEFSEEK